MKNYLWFVLSSHEDTPHRKKINELIKIFSTGSTPLFSMELTDFEILPIGSKIELFDEFLGGITFKIKSYNEARDLTFNENKRFIQVELALTQPMDSILFKKDEGNKIKKAFFEKYFSKKI